MKLRMSLATAASALALATFANAGFINGGFETGDFTGWTLEHGSNTSNNPATIVYSAGSAGHAYVVGPTADPYSPFDTPFNGNYMARLNEFTAPNYDATRISQQAVMAAGETDIFINWGAVMEDPSHSTLEQPFFQIDIFKNGVLYATDSHNASQGTANGWNAGPTGPNFSPTYYSSGTFNVSGLVDGDIVKVVMTVLDCGAGGHAGWAYLDGIGTVFQPPSPGDNTVPDGGTTLAMLGLALTGIAGVRRKFGCQASRS